MGCVLAACGERAAPPVTELRPSANPYPLCHLLSASNGARTLAHRAGLLAVMLYAARAARSGAGLRTCPVVTEPGHVRLSTGAAPASGGVLHDDGADEDVGCPDLVGVGCAGVDDREVAGGFGGCELIVAGDRLEG